MTQRQQRVFQAMRNSGWSGVSIPRGPDHPTGGPMLMVNGRADIVYILTDGHTMLIQNAVQKASGVILRSSQGAVSTFGLDAECFDYDRLSSLLETIRAAEPSRNR